MPISSASSSSFSSRQSDERKTHEFERSPYTTVSMSSLNYKATDRIVTLAKPKQRIDSAIRDGKISTRFLLFN